MSVEREQLEVDVLFVGAGPASLSAALHLVRLIKAHNQAVESGEKKGDILTPVLLVVEKGKEIGAHALSGAVVDPRGFDALLKGLETRPPYEAQVQNDALYYLTETKAFKVPVTPPPLQNHGYYVASLGQLVKWLAALCEEHEVEVYPGFPGKEILFDGGSVIGVRMSDSGVGQDGEPKANYEPGMDVKAKVTVLGEGPKGTLFGQADRQLRLSSASQPQIYAVGVKELWRVKRDLEPGVVYHSLGFPLGSNEFGGGFVYTMQEGLIDLGLVVGLDYEDPRTDCHRLLQRFKQHPFIRDLIGGGELVSYGAKAIPEGGLYAMPRLFADGLLVVGDSGGFLNSQRLKGIHLAVESGMLAAETLFEALVKGDSSAETLSAYGTRFENSPGRKELWKVRNFRQSFQKGFWPGMFHAALQMVSGGRGLTDPMPITAGHDLMRSTSSLSQPTLLEVDFDGTNTFDKLSSLYYSDTSHEEDQPSHLLIRDPQICIDKCSEEFGNPCQNFCPASVYEIIREGEQPRLQVNSSNCVHCKTCEIMDPYQIILWTPPEGGGGPDWKKM
ncbi:MAG TPA: electron transfer flavoprotein-ubiquinone oxidoreductase [Acidobacteriota bacterium]|nr:electron transfer flavoprotein-ubiquinone oxidoreductase [Acidobacteriota bacterium]